MTGYAELDNFVRHQRFRLFRKVALVTICGIILIAPFALLEIPVDVQEVVGTGIAPSGEPTETGTFHYLIVRLDDGQIVRALISSDILFRKDRRVAVKETTTMFFGYKRYKFLRYSDNT